MPEEAVGDVQVTKSLLRGMAVLEAMAQVGDPIGPAKLGELVGLDKATVSRLLATFAHAGYVVHDHDTGRSRLTSRVLRLSRGFLEHFDLRTLSRPHLTALRDATGETVHFGQLDGERVVYIDKLESTSSIRLVSAVGQTMPVHTTALGKAMLAASSEEDRIRFVDRLDLRPVTSSSFTDATTLLADLERTAERGWAVDAGENEANVLCVGAAIVDGNGQVLGAISVSGPHFRMEHRLDEVGARCRDAADRIRADVVGSELPPAHASFDGEGPWSESPAVLRPPNASA